MNTIHTENIAQNWNLSNDPDSMLLAAEKAGVPLKVMIAAKLACIEEAQPHIYECEFSFLNNYRSFVSGQITETELSEKVAEYELYLSNRKDRNGNYHLKYRYASGAYLILWLIDHAILPGCIANFIADCHTEIPLKHERIASDYKKLFAKKIKRFIPELPKFD